MASAVLCACALTLACGSDPSQVAATPEASPETPAPSPLDAAGVSLHLVRSFFLPDRARLLSFQIDSTGRPKLSGSLDLPEGGDLVGYLAADPRGRRVYLWTSKRVTSYSFDSRSGRLTETDTASNFSVFPGVDLSDFSADALTASARYLYLTSHYRMGSRPNYQLTTFAVADDGKLRTVDAEALGTDYVAGPHVVVSPDGQIVYLLARGDYDKGMVMRANAVDAHGHLIEKAALRFPGTRGTGEDGAFFSVGGVLLASLGREDDDVLASVTFDRRRAILELRGLITPPGRMRPFGADGLLVLSDGRLERYVVNATGVLGEAEAVPDPERYYSDQAFSGFYGLGFHPSWRLAYRVGATTIRTFGVASSGQLTLIEETPLPQESGPMASSNWAILGRAF